MELNNSFYNLPEASVFANWRDRTPDGFVMAVKVSRYLTHIKKLNEPPSRSAASSSGPPSSGRGWARC